jgi:RimJ/RimL family protein N-acetyltransferase
MQPTKIILRDGREITVTLLTREIPSSALQSYINELVDEDAFLLVDKKYSLTEEMEWKRRALEEADHGQSITLIALYGERVIAALQAKRDRMKEKDNVSFGIAIAKDFRGVGLGEILLGMIINEAKKKLKPKNMYIAYIDGNIPAMRLYRKIGFKKIIGKYPKWVKHKGRYRDRIVLLYSN